jgi:extracellular elastinolytic metalloproteinase
MQDNWYETSVSATAPHKIISVVDWASDAPIPKVPEVVPATYNVFKWGINDPSVGSRSIEKENFDSLASPIGWHAIPYAHDPSFKGVRLTTKDFYRNTTTTWGNNVRVSNIHPELSFIRLFFTGLRPGELGGSECVH